MCVFFDFVIKDKEICVVFLCDRWVYKCSVCFFVVVMVVMEYVLVLKIKEM